MENHIEDNVTITPSEEKQISIEMRHICKRFEDVIALDDVNLMLQVGEVHALLGENGAGKTTLMNILTGIYRADSGEIFVKGQAVIINEPRDALKLGVAMVHQHFELIDNFTALDNIILGQEGRGLVIDVAQQEKKVTELSANYGFNINLRAKVKELAIGTRQKVEILKALYRGADILILDEPTTMLTPQEVDGLFSTIHRLVVNGLTVVLITHKIQEVLSISDRITIMRRGKVVETIPTQESNMEKLITFMMGTYAIKEAFSGSEMVSRCDQNNDQPVLQVKNLVIKDSHHFTVVKGASFDLRYGEIVGLVGVAGNGQCELAEAIAGLRPAIGGHIVLCGEDVTRKSIKHRMARGITLVPEDRIGQGILPHLSVAETMVLGVHHFLYHGDHTFNLIKANQRASQSIKEFDIRAPSELIATTKLSGGNIQKVLLARAFMMDDLVGIRLLIAFNPTRGLDIMTTNFIHSKLIGLRSAGKSSLLISEDLDEALDLCDRILVMRSGRLVSVFDKNDFDRYVIGAAMVSGEGLA
jgi:ABC-type uncharacterized transport system ATPase subunit